MADMAVPEPTGANRYIMGRCLGSGAFGDVYEAIDQVTQRFVAVKMLKSAQISERDVIVTEGNVRNLSEIHVLSKLDHPNIIKLLNVYEHDNTHHLVFELMTNNLSEIIRDQSLTLSPADCKSYMQMFLQGLAYLHENFIIHRDVKPNNLLIGRDGQLKLADFGSACYCNDEKVFRTPQVFVTRYRAPELLRGFAVYGPEVDMWAAGCTFARLISRHSFFTCEDNADQLREIFNRFLVPSKTQSQSICEELEYNPIQYFRQAFPTTSEDCLDLLHQMFAYEPKWRITAQQALEHRYFTSAPLPTPIHLLPRRDPTQVNTELHL